MGRAVANKYLYDYGPPVLVGGTSGSAQVVTPVTQTGTSGAALPNPGATTQKAVGGADLAFGVRYLDPALGTVSTPDAPEFRITGDVRFTSAVRLTSLPAAGAGIAAQRASGGTDLSFDIYVSSTGAVVSRYSMTGTAFTTSSATTPTGVVAPGVDSYVGGRLRVANATGGHDVIGLTSSDRGQTWTDRTTVAGAGTFEGFDSTAALSFGLVPSTFVTFPGRTYWAQMDAIGRARLVLPGVIGNYLASPTPTLAAGTRRQVVMRISTDWDATVPDLPDSFAGIFYQSQRLGIRRTGARQLQCYWYQSAGGSQTLAVTYAAGLFAAGQSVWWRFTVGTDIARAEYSTADTAVEPTSWTLLTDGAARGDHFAMSGNVYLGADSAGTTRPFGGQLRRVIVRADTGQPAAFDVSENNAGTMVTPTTFVANTGQTITVNKTTGNTIVQPQPESVIWRFDAAEYPGSGTTWTDPRGRQWTASSAAALVLE